MTPKESNPESVASRATSAVSVAVIALVIRAIRRERRAWENEPYGNTRLRAVESLAGRIANDLKAFGWIEDPATFVDLCGFEENTDGLA